MMIGRFHPSLGHVGRALVTGPISLVRRKPYSLGRLVWVHSGDEGRVVCKILHANTATILHGIINFPIGAITQFLYSSHNLYTPNKFMSTTTVRTM
jgi:hypothetical protein